MENLKVDSEEDLVQVLDEAQRNAREQRLAAERFLQETLALEQRLAQEAEAARNASELALKRELLAAIEEIGVQERAALEQAEACAKKRAELEGELQAVERRLEAVRAIPWRDTLNELRELEARRRIAERRAADVARGIAS
ncbi:MAG TPA: hypothetical protein VJP76_01925 [Candidatus Tumulicola sp.]|nr:hypothetical protein [Candidatus Tumulicola sp.]